jgi:hypothetical protein
VVPLCTGPPCKSHVELRWRLTKEFHPSLTKESPRLGGSSTPLLGEFLNVRQLSFSSGFDLILKGFMID